PDPRAFGEAIAAPDPRPAQRPETPAHPACDDRLELRPPLRRGAGALPPPLPLHRGHYLRSRKGGLRSRSRHPAVARREEPPTLLERALLDDRNGPGVRGRAAGGKRGNEGAAAAARCVLRSLG